MRILFVDNLLLEDKGGTPDYVLQPHLGLISLIAVAEAAGHEGLLYDPKLAIARGELRLDESLYREIADQIVRMRPDVVGLTTLGCNFICTLKIANYLKRFDPNLPILLGGPHATVLDRIIIERFQQFDVIVRNEAELKLIPLLNALPSGRLDDVPGITFLRGSDVAVNPGDPIIEDLDAIPIGAYGRYPIKDLQLDWLRVDAGRGCPFKCTFCSTASFFGRRYRLKSAGRLVAELEYLRAEFGISTFSLTHDLFTVNRKKVIEFCQAAAGKGFVWKCSARMDCVDPELLEIMYDAGCRNIYYGIETGSRRMQEVTQKHLDLGLFDPTLDITQKLGISATASFIVGYPQEEQYDQDETLDLAGSCYYRRATALNVQLHLLTPEPGTHLIHEFANALRYDGHITDFNFPTLELDDSDIMRENPDIFMNHHFYPSSVPRERNIFVTEVFHVINNLGNTVVTCLLETHERKLSRLMDQMYTWFTRVPNRGWSYAELLSKYISDRLGSKHIVTSLVRYMTAAARISGRLHVGSNPGHLVGRQSGTGACLTLSPSASILRDIHNCPMILEHMNKLSSPVPITIPDRLLAEQCNIMLLFEEGCTEAVRNFILDYDSAVLIESFCAPRLVEECLAEYSAAGIDPLLVSNVLSQMLASGVLKQVNALRVSLPLKLSSEREKHASDLALSGAATELSLRGRWAIVLWRNSGYSTSLKVTTFQMLFWRFIAPESSNDSCKAVTRWRLLGTWGTTGVPSFLCSNT